MRPIFRITVDGVDSTAKFNDRTLEIDVIDKAGSESDELTIKVDDRGYVVQMPKRGTMVRVWLGYEHTGLVYLGSYKVDESWIEGPPRSLSIKAKATDMQGKLKAQRTEPNGYQNKTVADVVQEVAGRHGLAAQVRGQVALKKIARLDQVDESDLHLLTRLAQDYDAFFKIGNGQLLFMSKTETGLSQIEFTESDLSAYRFGEKDRGRYSKAKAKWHNKKRGKREEEEASGGDANGATYYLRHQFPDKDRASAAAEAKLRELRRLEGEMSIEVVPGNPRITAGGTCTVALRSGSEGPWHMKEVRHSYSSEGIRTKISGESKAGSKKR